MPEASNFFTIISDAGIVVKCIMGALMLASLVSWFMIFKKIIQLKKAIKSADQFEDRFWSGGDLSEMYSRISHRQYEPCGMERIFMAGFKEFSRMRRQEGVDSDAILDATNRTMNVALSREIDELESNIPFLATVGSTSPYVGLFGTVWGIMNSFMALSDSKQTSISAVAPGIAEALIATAIGLFAAIPAVVAYNRFSTRVDRLITRHEIFLDEFLGILQRQTHVKKPARQKLPEDI
ncbi:MAG: protein TolQ [Gammaproteobacteria bacterium]|nr:MAG: protein TolQ [Gammaproteobacteria bacterium]